MAAATIPQVALESARRFGPAIAIATEGMQPLTYAELGERMIEAAQAFAAAGVGPGDRVAIWAPNIERWIVAALGIQAAGGVLVPMNTRYKGAEAAFILRASGARMLLTVSNFLGNAYPEMIAAEGLGDIVRTVLMDDEDDWGAFIADGRSLGREAALDRLREVKGNDLSDILFTSGTTGQPKGVMTTHAQNLAVYAVYSAGLGWTAEDRLLAINPFFHSFGYKAGWLCSLMRGSRLHPVQMFDAPAALDQIEAFGITLMPGPPTVFQSLLALPLQGRRLSSLRLAVTGAAVVPEALIHAMRERLGYDHVITAYGLTETCGVVSMCAIGDDIHTIAITSGRPIEHMELKVVDVAGAAVAPGTSGEILARGPNVMQGYFQNPEATAAAIDAEGWLRTGDIGEVRADGYVRITDRAKDVYISGGFNVSPAEVENLLLAHPAVAEAAVVGVADERLGEVGHAFIVARADAAPMPDAAALTAWARMQMANFKVPRAFTVVPSLPRTASGKVEKFKLKDMLR